VPRTSTSRSLSQPQPVVVRLTIWGLLAVQGALAASSGYLVALLLAAWDSARARPEPPSRRPRPRLRLVVLVPAHDEQAGIRATLDSVAGCAYPAEALRTIVIADNCSDRTADRARAAGVEVWERTDPTRRGKGPALAWALGRLQAAAETYDAVVVLDADCLASPNIFSAIEGRLRSGAGAVQVNYVAGNPDASQAARLRFAGYALTNTVRFAGKQRLGLSCGLIGSGMAFTSDLLRRAPWTATGLVEDAEYHMRLIAAGERAEFVPEAWVSSAVPTTLRGSPNQQARWEQGKLELIRQWSPRLVGAGLARRDVTRFHAGLECLVPPQSLIAAGSAASALAGALLGSRRLLLLSTATLAAQASFVFGGLRLVRAPVRVYGALLVAPVLVVGKVALYARLSVGRGPKTWVRTEREQPATAGEPR